MEKMKHVGTFHSVDNVLYKITELEAQGYPKKDIYAVSNVQDNFDMLRADAELNLLVVENRNLLDHTKELFIGKHRMLQVFEEMGFSEQEALLYFDELKEGGVALFIEARWNGPATDEMMDSQMERGISGEPLDGQRDEGKVYLNENTVPRIDTTNL
ncbi:general stress protein [Sporosarcina sp. 179-K 3D1 HS]|uniref:general stress protein n=1 Tax=Sporosarcina sp. 179-K 3D1 HS TaxID=3232169 RepID=UPI0039A1ACA7